MIWILPIVSLVAIVLLALLTKRLFPNADLLTKTRVEDNFKRTFPEAMISTLIFSDDKLTAFITSDTNQAGFAFVHGDRIVCRYGIEQPAIKENIVTFASASFNDSDHKAIFSKSNCESINASFSKELNSAS